METLDVIEVHAARVQTKKKLRSITLLLCVGIALTIAAGWMFYRSINSAFNVVNDLEAKRVTLSSEIVALNETKKELDAKISELKLKYEDAQKETTIVKALGKVDQIFFVRYPNDKASKSLSQRVTKFLNGKGLNARPIVANYQGPSKKRGFVVQVRYSAPSDEGTANTVAKQLTGAGMPAYVNHVPEPGGQQGQFRVWVLE